MQSVPRLTPRTVSQFIPPRGKSTTYVHVDNHSVALKPVHSSRNDNQRLLSDKVANTPLLLGALAASVRNKVKLECVGDPNKHQQTAEPLQRRALQCHGVLCCVDVLTLTCKKGYEGKGGL